METKAADAQVEAGAAAAASTTPPAPPAAASSTVDQQEAEVASAAAPTQPLDDGKPSSESVWQNKTASCEALRSFEARRKRQIDGFQTKDRAYWRQFQEEIRRACDENARLQRFFSLRVQADLAYAESLRKLRQAMEPPASSSSGLSTAITSGGGSGSGSGEQLNVQSSVSKALHTLGEVQQQLSEKLVQFATVVKRDVMVRPLEEMVSTYSERVGSMLSDGKRLDATLFETQKQVLAAFDTYDALFREMESEKERNPDGAASGSSSSASGRQDLWLAEMNYCLSVHKLRQCRVEYVTGMSALFQQYKTLEVWRGSVVQTALDTYVRKQKLVYSELAGAMAEPMASAQRIDPERDLLQSVRRIPKNYTAAALSTSENSDQKLFATLRSPIASPLLVRCGFLKHQVTGSLFSSWKDVLCAITQDARLHLLELKENTTQAVSKSMETMLGALVTGDQGAGVSGVSVCLTNCRIEILAKSAEPSFELTELSPPSGIFSSVFRLDLSRTFTFQCSSQSDLIDWVVAAKRFISAGSSMVNR